MTIGNILHRGVRVARASGVSTSRATGASRSESTEMKSSTWPSESRWTRWCGCRHRSTSPARAGATGTSESHPIVRTRRGP